MLAPKESEDSPTAAVPGAIQIPAHLQFRATLNFLEFIASTVGIWIDIIEDNTQPLHSTILDCELSMTDSSITDG